MNVFDLLSKNIQKKIWDMKWESFTPIQDKAIPTIINTDKDVVISSGTASGKTEAAFLPIITLVEEGAQTELKVIYISPIKALINNQFERIEKLCEYSNIQIHRWHGDVNQNAKNKFIKNPSGFLQITPESIESLFTNRTERIPHLFKNVDFIVIDEIHAFLDNERGVHLRSLLYRLENYSKKRPRIVGLSATVDNFDFVKEWVNSKNKDNVEIIEEKNSSKSLNYNLMHFSTAEDNKEPMDLFEDMRDLTREYKSIIFCNSRGQVEETTVFLNRLANKEKVEESYFAHHSSVDKKEREYVEQILANSRSPKSIVATSSLELGIDIGEIDLVIQKDSTFTVSSLKQRLGRSGRRQGTEQLLQLYTTTQQSLVQSLAVMELNLEKWVEPAVGYAKPFDVLFHQIMSICNERNGVTLEELLKRIRDIHIFNELNTEDVILLIQNMAEKDILELVKGKNEYIVGIEGERILRSRDFYAVFHTSEEYLVLEGAKPIGALDKKFPVEVDGNIILAGKLWTIKDIDTKRNKIYVQKATNGKKPTYFGDGGSIHKKIGDKMIEILCSNEDFVYINEEANDVLEELRKKYKHYKLTKNDRVIWIDKGEIYFETYAGTKIARTIALMFRVLGYETGFLKAMDGVELNGGINLKGEVPTTDLIKKIKNKDWSEHKLMSFLKEEELFTSKFTEFLPKGLVFEMHIAHEIDIKGTLEFLNQVNVKIINISLK